jgi:FdhE protein
MSDVRPQPELINIGEEAKPPFAVLPDASSLFLTRSQRFAAIASAGHDLGPYLSFLATLTFAQHEIVPGLPQPALPPFDRIGQALEHGMPPISRTLFEPDDVSATTIERLLERLASAQVSDQTAAALAALRSASAEQRRKLATEALKDTEPEDIAQRALVAAGLQVHFARLAGMLAADDLRAVADGACPVCGSPPMTTSVVGWPRAHNTRFCACSLCATQWNVVRVKCVLCSSTDGISFRGIEGQPDTIKAETCEKCRSYVKRLYQVNDHMLEPLADDVASLGLDMLVIQDGWKRGGLNPFLLGY